MLQCHYFAGLEEQYERCERQSYQVTEVNLKLFLADFQGLCQVLTYGIFPKEGGEGAQNMQLLLHPKESLAKLIKYHIT